MAGMPGFFNVDERMKRLSELGDQIEAYARGIDFEPFARILKRPVLCDWRPGCERAEFLIGDRLCFMRFLGLGLSHRAPDAHTMGVQGAAEEGRGDRAAVGPRPDDAGRGGFHRYGRADR